MKLKNILYYLAVIVLFTSQLWAQNTNPVVTYVAFSISGTTVTVNYDVTDAEQSTVTISMEVSSDGGATWNYNYGSAGGDIGAGINSQDGLTKTITWTYSDVQNSNFQIKIIADDLFGDQIYYAGKIYNTVTIGSQVWLKENLDVGTMINGTNGGTNSDGQQINNGTIEKYCYGNITANCTNYGGLYQWNEAMQYVTTEGTKGICPTGWHIPTEAEFATLATTVSNDENALKAVGQGTAPGAGTNTSGFSALLVGYYNGGFLVAGSYTFF
jgi:uncharacterized protein (TIGR02145 family)